MVQLLAAIHHNFPCAFWMPEVFWRYVLPVYMQISHVWVGWGARTLKTICIHQFSPSSFLVFFFFVCNNVTCMMLHSYLEQICIETLKFIAKPKVSKSKSLKAEKRHLCPKISQQSYESSQLSRFWFFSSLVILNMSNLMSTQNKKSEANNIE